MRDWTEDHKDSNILDTLDLDVILRDNAGLARMVEHHTDLKVSAAIEAARDNLKDEIVANLDAGDLPSRLIESIEEGLREEIENDRESSYESGYEEGVENANENREVTLRPSERGTRIVASNGHTISAEAVRKAYIHLKAGTLVRGSDVDGYDIRYLGPETIQLGCTEVSREEVEYLALAMGWKAHEDGKVVREVSPVISERPDYQSGYEAGVQFMRDRLAGMYVPADVWSAVLDATVTRNG